MRTGCVTATALMLALGLALPVLADPVLADDDPLAALAGTETLDARSNGKRPKAASMPLGHLVPLKPAATATITLPAPAPEALPPSFNTGAWPAPPPPPAGGWTGNAGGGWWPTPPTPPTIPFWGD